MCVYAYIYREEEREWINHPQNFDNIIFSLRTLFQIATLSSWTNVMHMGMGIQDVGVAPVLYSAPYSFLYFVLSVLLCSVFTLNLFIGVTIDNFNEVSISISIYLILIVITVKIVIINLIICHLIFG